MTQLVIVLIAVAWLFWLPGFLFAHLLRLRFGPDWLVQMAVELGLGFAFWPVLFLWTSTVGLAWSPGMGSAAAIGIGLVGLGFWGRSLLANRRVWHSQVSRQALTLTLFGCIFALTLMTRALHIQELALPVWVDSVHHTMVARLLVDQGRLPQTYAPFIPQVPFLYHWGFHLQLGWLAWLLQRTDPFDLTDLMLSFGQVLNALTTLMAYAVARQLFASRRAGLLAAALVGTVAWFPAFYVSWGRYTQLAGLLLLAPFVIALLRLGRKPGLRLGGAVMLLGAGLVLTHIRAAFFGLPLVVLLALTLGFQRRWQGMVSWVAAGGGVLAITAPWLVRLVQDHFARTLLIPTQMADYPAFNDVQWSLVWIPRSWEILAGATAGLSAMLGWGEPPSSWLGYGGLVWFLFLVLLILWRHLAWERRSSGSWLQFLRRSRLLGLLSGLGLLAVWVGLLAALLNLNWFGLPVIRIASNNSAIIALFVPVCLAAAGWVAWALGQLAPLGWAEMVTGLVALGLTIGGAQGMREVVNPVTVLATPADRVAMRWIRENVGPQARFAVQVWRWQGPIYAGADGGYWLQLLTDRESVLPPALYSAELGTELVAKTQAFLESWVQVQDVNTEASRQLLLDDGVTHLYVGPRQGHLQPDLLRLSPFLDLIYDRDGVLIFEVK